MKKELLCSVVGSLYIICAAVIMMFAVIGGTTIFTDMSLAYSALTIVIFFAGLFIGVCGMVMLGVFDR